jgi:hypothetical protein
MWTCPEDLVACVGKVPAVNVLSQSLPSSYAKAEMMHYAQGVSAVASWITGAWAASGSYTVSGHIK